MARSKVEIWSSWSKVLDGDSLVAVKEGQAQVTIRLVGIKSFDAKVEKDVATPFAQAAMELIQRSMTDRPARVLLHSSSKDNKYGRYLATLYADDEDLTLETGAAGAGAGLHGSIRSRPCRAICRRAGAGQVLLVKCYGDRALALIREWRSQNQ